MHPTIQQGLTHLQNANYAGYFEEIGKVVPPGLQVIFNEHKGRFITGQYPYNFHQQLDLFAREVEKTITPEKETTVQSTQSIPGNQRKTLYIIFADLKGYGSNAGNDDLISKVTEFLFSLQRKHFTDRKKYFFKAIGDGILATGYSLTEMAEKALIIRDEIKNYHWTGEGFANALNVRIALHTGEAIEHYNPDNTIKDVSGTAILQTARLEPYTLAGEVFCSQTYANLLSPQTTHNLATLPLGTYNLGKAHDMFEMDIAVLFRSSDREMYREYKGEKCQKHLKEKTQDKKVENPKVTQTYTTAQPLSQETKVFQQALLTVLDTRGFQGVPEVFQKISDCPYQYNQATLSNLKNQAAQPLTGLAPDGFLVGLKSFILSIQ